MQEPEVIDEVVDVDSPEHRKAMKALTRKIERDTAAYWAEEDRKRRELKYMPRKNTPKDQREIVRHGPALPLTPAGVAKLGHAPRGRKRG